MTFATSVSSRLSNLLTSNTSAVLTLPGYLLLRPLLRLTGVLHAPSRRPQGPWVFGGHSGRLYTDNAAALHAEASRAGRSVVWIAGSAELERQLTAAGHRVLRRNSLRARIAIENAEALLFSHGITDLEHVSWMLCEPRGLKVHLNHCMSHLKAAQLVSRLRATGETQTLAPVATRMKPFDHLLASSERERKNLRTDHPGREARVVLGGGAHLDAFLAARAQPPGRSIVYFPTFRETPTARARLEREIDALASDPRLSRWLEARDFTFCIARHANSQDPTRTAVRPSARVRFVPPDQLIESLIGAAMLVSDYSGLICDYLALDRPTVFFPFDQVDYLTRRRLYVDYDDFCFGPVVRTSEALVDLLCSDSWLDMRAHEAKRRQWKGEFFPSLEPDYAARSLQTVCELLEARHGDHVVRARHAPEA